MKILWNSNYFICYDRISSKEALTINKYTNKELADLLNADFSKDKDAIIKVFEIISVYSDIKKIDVSAQKA